MKTFKYLPRVTTLVFKEEACIGCGICQAVCPHQVFAQNNGKARVVNRDDCMECGACMVNCPTGAAQVTPGVGCAEYIIKSWFKGKSVSACC